MSLTLRTLLWSTAIISSMAFAQEPEQPSQIEALVTETGEVQVCSRRFSQGDEAALIAAIRHCPVGSAELPTSRLSRNSQSIIFMPLPGSGGTPPTPIPGPGVPQPGPAVPLTSTQEATLERLQPLMRGNRILLQLGPAGE